MKRIIVAVATLLFAAGARAFHCPADMKIDDALAKNLRLTEAQMADVKKYRAEGGALHKAQAPGVGRHARQGDEDSTPVISARIDRRLRVAFLFLVSLSAPSPVFSLNPKIPAERQVATWSTSVSAAFLQLPMSARSCAHGTPDSHAKRRSASPPKRTRPGRHWSRAPGSSRYRVRRAGLPRRARRP